MKIYIGNRNIDDQEYKRLGDPKALMVVADDAECTSIVLDSILHKYPLEEATGIIKECIKKLRIGGNFIVADLDFDLLAYLYKINPDIVNLNAMIANIGGIKSVLTYSFMTEVMKNFPNLELKVAQSANVEFRVEYVRKS